eukprot:77954_1
MKSRILIQLIVHLVWVSVVASLTNENLKPRFRKLCEIKLGVYPGGAHPEYLVPGYIRDFENNYNRNDRNDRVLIPDDLTEMIDKYYYHKDNKVFLWPAIPIVFNRMEFKFLTSPDIGVKTLKAYIRQSLELPRKFPLSHLHLWFGGSKVQMLDDKCLEDYREHIERSETAYVVLDNVNLDDGKFARDVHGKIFDGSRLYCMDFLEQFGDQQGELLKRAVRLENWGSRIWLYELLFVSIPDLEEQPISYMFMMYLRKFQYKLVRKIIEKNLVSLRFKSYKIDELPENLNPSFRMYGEEKYDVIPRYRGYNPYFDDLWKFPREIDLSLCTLDGVDRIYLIVLLENKLRHVVGRALLTFNCRTLSLSNETLMWNTCNDLNAYQQPERVQTSFDCREGKVTFEFNSNIFLDKLGFRRKLREAKLKLRSEEHSEGWVLYAKGPNDDRETLLPIIVGFVVVFLTFGIMMACIVSRLGKTNNGVIYNAEISKIDDHKVHLQTEENKSNFSRTTTLILVITALILIGLMSVVLYRSSE